MRQIRAALIAATVVLLLGSATSAFAKEFYDAYFDGVKAAKEKKWSVVIQKMTEALSMNPNESDRARSYGTQFFKYHPYYYRGIAYFSTEQFEKAVDDLQKATGPGDENLGTVDSYISRAETRLTLIAQQHTPPPPPTNTVVVTPPPPTPRPTPPPPRPTPAPSVDPAVAAARSNAENLMRSATARMNDARHAKADIYATGEFGQAQQLLLDARSKSASADSAAEWNQVASIADRSGRSFEAAKSRAEVEAPSHPGPPAPAQEAKARIKHALDLYFTGSYRASAEEFEQLTHDQSKNAMIWAFLGASRYYAYLLDGEGNTSDRQAAEDAFRRARQIKPSLQLSDKYFAPRIRKVFEATR